MIQVLVVEDEPPILRDVVNRIEAVDPRFTVVEKAYDGLRAIELLEDMDIDVVFTDINMPLCDGLHLLEHLSRNYPHIQAIVLSGYQEFSYAQQAIRYGVTDYLLKPVKDENLKTVLANLAARHQERLDRERQQVLNDIIHRRLPGEPDAHLSFGRPDTPLLMALLCAGTLPLSPTGGELPAAEFWADAGQRPAIGAQLGRFNGATLLLGETAAERLLITPVEAFPYSDTLLHDLFNTLNQYGCPVSIVACTRYTAGQLKEGYRQLRGQLAGELVFASPRLVLDRMQPPGTAEYLLPSHMERQMAVAAEQNNFRQYAEVMEKVLDELAAHKATQLNVETVIKRMLDIPLVAVASHQGTVSGYGLRVQNMLSGCYTYAALYEKLYQLAKGIFEAHITHGDKDRLVEEIEAYIDMHLSEPVSSQTLSTRFGFSTSYIGKLFKAKNGQTPGDYLLKKRIEKAKALLLQDPGLKSKDVAQIVGYPDALYFSRVFKKETGVYPSEFRSTTQDTGG